VTLGVNRGGPSGHSVARGLQKKQPHGYTMDTPSSRGCAHLACSTDAIMFHRIFVCRRCGRELGGCTRCGAGDITVEKVDSCATCNHKQKET
jgi:hypothetical protein